MRIVMAEDDPDDRFLFIEELKNQGLTENIAIVNDGVELLDYLHQRGKFNSQNALRPDLIAIDCRMPKLNGIETLNEIRSYRKFEDIPIVFLTSSESETEYYQIQNLGVYSYLTKPISYADLVGSVNQNNTFPIHDQA